MTEGIEQLFVDKIKKEDINANNLWHAMKKDLNGLIPAIIQDFATREILMMAYMNEESFGKTLETGFMHYYSRSRGSLWLKGETSGHFQRVIEARIDCDQDTLLFIIDQTGAACHTGETSCFYRPIEKLKSELAGREKDSNS